MPYFILLIPLIIGCIFPIGGMVASFYVLYRYTPFNKTISLASLFFISVFWGLLAFTQKPATDIETDCIRYYLGMLDFETIPIKSVWENIGILDAVNFVFYPISHLLVSATGNVQTISLVWVTVSYFAFYLSIYRLLGFYNIDRKKYAQLILFFTFFLVMFVQISDLLKNASGFALMFLAWTYYFTDGWNLKSFIIIIIAIGVHPSSLLLILLFFNKRFNTRRLITYSILLIPIALLAGNAFILLLNMLPGTMFTDMLLDRFGGYESEKGITLLYLAIVTNIYILSVYIWNKNGKNDDYIVNAAIVFVIICFLNYTNFVAFKRLTLFSHSIYIPLLIRSLSTTRSLIHDKILLVSVILMMACFNAYTRGRLYGHYSSSYMDNSIVKISTSTLPDYLAEKWY